MPNPSRFSQVGTGTSFALSGGVTGSTRAFHAAAALLLGVFASGGCDANADTSSEPPPRVAVEPPALRVDVVRAGARTLAVDTTATGQLHAFKTATVSAEVAGRVTARMVERGAQLERGSTVFRVDTKASQLRLAQSKANAGASDLDLGIAERELARGKQLREGNDISASAYDQLEHRRDAAKQRRALAEINRKLSARSVADGRVQAPFDGRVVQLHAEVGDYVRPGTPLMTIADLSRMRLRVGVTASEAALLGDRPDSPVSVRFDALGGRDVEATLHDISPLADARSGTYAAEFWLEPVDDVVLRQGMVGRVNLGGERTEVAVAVPRHAVTRNEGAFAVWVVEEGESGDVARRRAVTLGRRDATHTEISSGLQGDERVVVEGSFSLADGAAVEIDGDA